MRDFIRGAVRLHVLHHAAEHELHGAWMADELARHGYEISPGTLYPALHAMEEEGLLTSTKKTVEGRVLRSYRTTAKGRKTLARGKKALAELAKELL
jgi:DNA-binding PadR family transcriptional regulator